MAGKQLRIGCGVAILLSVVLGGAIATAQGTNYVVGASDVLAIDVFNQPQLKGNFAVDTDGTFTFPFIGRVTASGLTLRQLEEELKTRLANGFLKNPQVSVSVEQYRSQRVFVIGEVRAPGSYALTGDMSLIEALARAGSATPDAGGEALIVRPHQNKPSSGPLMPTPDAEVVHVDLKELQSGKMSQNVPLQDGDTIFVPRAELVYISGQVRNPGSYSLQRGMTVLQALSLAGGITDRGASNRIKVIRMVNGKRTERKITLEDTVLAGDTLVVPERFF